LVATIRAVRKDLLTDFVLPEDAKAIPLEPPPDFLKKDVPSIEGIGQPTTACFFTMSNINPSKWYPLPQTKIVNILEIFSVSNTNLSSASRSLILGGYLKSMTGCEDFGIQPTRLFILGWATNYHYLMRLWMPCPLISSWMESYGE